MTRHVVVIGAGAIGTISALELLRAGHAVTLVDPGAAGGEQAASYGNAGWLSVQSVLPPAEPGVWKKVPSYLADPLGPLSIRWSYFPRILPWLVKYLLSGWTPARVHETARALRLLLADAPQLHGMLAAEAGVGHLIEHNGTLHVYPSRAAFEADGFAWSVRRANGIAWQELSGDALRAEEPALPARYGFAALVPDAGRCLDPGAYIAALATLAGQRGAVLHRASASGFRFEGERLAAVRTDAGEIPCDAAVVAAGIRSKPLAAALGDSLPLEAERGYHVTFEGAATGLRRSFMASDVKMVINPMAMGLRGAGQVEFAGVGAAPDWKRAGILRDHLSRLFPDADASKAKVWVGDRPSMPDGRPCIGHARRCNAVVYAFGHGHVGLAGSARTGRLVAQLIDGREPEIPVGPFAPGRYL